MAKKTNFKVGKYNYFKVSATVGYTNGKRIRKMFYGTSKKEAEQKRDEYINGIKNGLSVDYDKVLFSDIFKEWLWEVKKPHVKDSTFARYEGEYRLRIRKSKFFTMRLIDVKSIHIKRFYNNIAKKNINFAHEAHKILSSFFNYCVTTELLIKNPLISVKKPTNNKYVENSKNKFMLEDSDIYKLIEEVKRDNQYFIFMFLCFTGLRIGEALGLTQENIDFKNKIINVRKSLKYNRVFKNDENYYEWQLTTPKTKKSIRQVPLLENLIPFFEIHLENEKNKKKKLPYIFTSQNGWYKDTSTLRKSWKRLCERLEIKPVNVHNLRHTFCSILAMNNVPIIVASELLGHTNTKITEEIYSHVNMHYKKEAISTFKTYFD